MTTSSCFKKACARSGKTFAHTFVEMAFAECGPRGKSSRRIGGNTKGRALGDRSLTRTSVGRLSRQTEWHYDARFNNRIREDVLVLRIFDRPGELLVRSKRLLQLVSEAIVCQHSVGNAGPFAAFPVDCPATARADELHILASAPPGVHIARQRRPNVLLCNHLAQIVKQ